MQQMLYINGRRFVVETEQTHKVTELIGLADRLDVTDQEAAAAAIQAAKDSIANRAQSLFPYSDLAEVLTAQFEMDLGIQADPVVRAAFRSSVDAFLARGDLAEWLDRMQIEEGGAAA